eukprot:Skav209285  [mRNA]  locus=scaffold251:14758:16077:+ [translate_table: standard]
MRYILHVFFALSLAEPNSWQDISPVGSTPKRRNHMAMWSEIDDGFYVYGGRDENYALRSDLQFYSRQSNSWAEIVPNGTLPSALQEQTAVWSNSADGFYLFGGCCWENDLHFYSRDSNSWEKLSPAGTLPMGREGHTSVWGDAADGFYVCGGFQSSFWMLDLNFYSRASNSWQRLSPSGSWPDARVSHTLVWSEIDDGFYLFGGWADVAQDDGGRWSTFERNDLYLYSRQANSWQQLDPSVVPTWDGLYWQTDPPSRRQEHAAVWSKQNDGFYVFGGYSSGYYLSDLHLYSRQRNEWQLLFPAGLVMARYQHAIVGSPQGFYVMGGRYSASDPYDDLTLYTWQTTTTTTTYTSSTQTTRTSTSSTFTSATTTATTITSTMTTSTISTSTVTTLTHTSSTTTLTTATSTWTLTIVQEAASAADTCRIKLVVLFWLAGCML